MKITLLICVIGLALMPWRAQAQVPRPEISQNASPVDKLALRSQEARFAQQTAAATARVAAACTNTTSLNFTQRPLSENWKNHVPVNVGAANTNTTISTAGSYVEPAGGNETTLIVSTNGGALNGQPLYWNADYTSSTNATTQIAYSFNRPVNNFSLHIQDIDMGTNSWIDVVTFTATQIDGTVLNMSAVTDATVVNNTAYNTVSGNKITGIQTNAPNSELASVTVTFNKPIVSFQITYQNTVNLTNPGNQYIGIDYMTWCTQSNVATSLNGPARAVVGASVTYTVTTTANGDYDASGVQPKVQLVPGLTAQSSIFPTGSIYNNSTGLLTLATLPLLSVASSSVSFLTFNMPASTVTGTASSTINTDDADPLDNNGTLAAAQVTTVTNGVPTAATKSTTTAANTAAFTPMPPLTATDPDNDALTYTIVGTSIANVSFGTVYYTRNGVRTALAGTSNVTLTAAEAATLEFKNATGTGTSSGALSYFASDVYGGISSTATYTIGIAGQPAVYTSPNVAFTSGAKDEVIATVTDIDGAITSASRVTGTLPTNLLFSTATGTFTRDNNKSIVVGIYNFTVTTNGPGGTSTSIPATIRITNTDTQAAYSTGNTYNRDALANGATLATVTDADGPLTSATTTNTLATGIALNATTGRLTVNSATPPTAGTYAYTVTTTDQAGGTTAAPVTITLRDDVEAVYTAVQSYNRDALISNEALAGVSDADGAVSSATLASGTLPAGSALNATTGIFSVSNATTLGALANGTYSFTVNTTDVTGGRSSSLVGVTLFETEAVYTLAPAKATGYADGFSLATVTDADGSISSAALSVSTMPAGVGLNASTGQFTVTDRTLLRTGIYAVQVRTTDITGGITLQSINLNIGTYPLPVELRVFTAKVVKNTDALLAWTTATEKNNDHFDVERSLNGADFAKIAEVKGRGNSTSPTEYVLMDAGIGAKANGTVYYRLNQVDFDGKSSYSPVRTVAFTSGATPAISLAPNPATSSTQLDLSGLPAGTYQVSVLDVTGRTVRHTTLAAGLGHELPLNGLANGTYVVRVNGTNNGQTVNLAKRLVKE